MSDSFEDAMAEAADDEKYIALYKHGVLMLLQAMSYYKQSPDDETRAMLLKMVLHLIECSCLLDKHGVDVPLSIFTPYALSTITAVELMVRSVQAGDKDEHAQAWQALFRLVDAFPIPKDADDAGATRPAG